MITDFLGSGKTTLLQRLLAAPQLSDTAVLVNEFGEVGLDHHLLRRLDHEIVLLQSGCLCCTIRGDLSAAILDLYSKHERGEILPFRRLVVETTGLADPVPILATVMAEPALRHHFRLGNVITTIDAMNGLSHLERQPELTKQAAVGRPRRHYQARHCRRQQSRRLENQRCTYYDMLPSSSLRLTSVEGAHISKITGDRDRLGFSAAPAIELMMQAR